MSGPLRTTEGARRTRRCLRENGRTEVGMFNRWLGLAVLVLVWGATESASAQGAGATTGASGTGTSSSATTGTGTGSAAASNEPVTNGPSAEPGAGDAARGARAADGEDDGSVGVLAIEGFGGFS